MGGGAPQHRELVAERQILQHELAARLKSREQNPWDGHKQVEHGRKTLARLFHHTSGIRFGSALAAADLTFEPNQTTQAVFFDSGTHSPLPPLCIRAGDSTLATYPVLNALATWAAQRQSSRHGSPRFDTDGCFGQGIVPVPAGING